MIVSEFDRACVECQISPPDKGYMTLERFLGFQRWFEVEQILKSPHVSFTLDTGRNLVCHGISLDKTLSDEDDQQPWQKRRSFTHSRSNVAGLLHHQNTSHCLCLIIHMDFKIKVDVLVLIQEKVLIYVSFLSLGVKCFVYDCLIWCQVCIWKGNNGLALCTSSPPLTASAE